MEESNENVQNSLANSKTISQTTPTFRIQQAVPMETEVEFKSNREPYTYPFEKENNANQEKYKDDIIAMLKGQETKPTCLTTFLYIILIIMVMLFVFIPLLLIVFTVITDILNQLLSVISLAYIAFNRIILNVPTFDYKFGQLFAQVCWLLYSMPVVTLIMYCAIKLIGFFFAVIKDQLFDFDYHIKYINKIKKWIIPEIYLEDEIMAKIIKEVRPEEAKKLETLLYVVKDENSEKLTQLIASGIFMLIVIGYIALILISLTGAFDIQNVFTGFTAFYLAFPLIGILEIISRSWRNTLAIVEYKWKFRKELRQMRETEVSYNSIIEQYKINMKLYQLGIGEKPPDIESTIKEKKDEIDLLRTKITYVKVPYFAALTALIKRLYKIKILEMVYPAKFIGMDDFVRVIEDNTPNLGELPIFTMLAWAAGIGMKIFLWSRDYKDKKNDADSYFPYSIIITFIYFLMGPYIAIMSHVCGTYSFKKESEKKMGERLRKVKMYKDMFRTKVKFIHKWKTDDNPLKTAWEQYREEIANKKIKNGVIFNDVEEEEDDNDANDDDDNEQIDEDDDYIENFDIENFQNENHLIDDANEQNKPSVTAIMDAANIDNLLSVNSITSAASFVQVLYGAVMVIVICCGLIVLSWKPPAKRISFDAPLIMYPSTIDLGYFDPPVINDSFCSVSINGLTVTELAALTIIPYYSYDFIPQHIRQHNINTIIELAFKRTKTATTEFKMNELSCKDEEECNRTLNDVTSVLEVRNDGVFDYNILIPFGMRDKGDWIPVLEMFTQQLPNQFLGDCVPLYDFFMDILRDVVYRVSTFFQKICGVRSVTIKHALRIKDIAEGLEGDHNIAVGQTIGGYFSKYIGYMLRNTFSAVGFNSLSFRENALCGDYDGEETPCSIINVFTEAFLEGEDNIAFNYKHENYDFGQIQSKIRPPNATDTFCHMVAQCSTDQNHIDFCMHMLGHDRFIDKAMGVYGREWHEYGTENEEK